MVIKPGTPRAWSSATGWRGSLRAERAAVALYRIYEVEE